MNLSEIIFLLKNKGIWINSDGKAGNFTVVFDFSHILSLLPDVICDNAQLCFAESASSIVATIIFCLLNKTGIVASTKAHVDLQLLVTKQRTYIWSCVTKQHTDIQAPCDEEQRWSVVPCDVTTCWCMMPFFEIYVRYTYSTFNNLKNCGRLQAKIKYWNFVLVY